MNSQNDHNDKLDLISRYLAQEATAEERQSLEAWMEADPANRKHFDTIKEAWDLSARAKDIAAINLDAEWQRMEAVIDQQASLGAKVVDMAPAQSSGNRMWLRIAAVLVVLVIGSTIGYRAFFSGTTMEAVAEVENAQLPDGTQIALNRNSELTYPKNFGKHDRKVKLEGEAFFEVKRDTEKPFIIDAGPVWVEVLGTSFYVQANEASDKVEVIVASGKVKVTDKKDKNQHIFLEAGKKGEFSKTSKELLSSVNQDENFLSWKTRKMVFNDKRLDAIVKTMNKVYGSNIIIGNEAMKSCQGTVTFDQQSLEEALNVLQTLIDLNITRKQESIVLSGDGC